jgi:hypothetical protein
MKEKLTPETADIVEAVTGIPYGARVFHGSPRTFQELDPARRGSNTEKLAASAAFFFTDKMEVAESFAAGGQEPNQEAIVAWLHNMSDGDVLKLDAELAEVGYLPLPAQKESTRARQRIGQYAARAPEPDPNSPPFYSIQALMPIAEGLGIACPENLVRKTGSVRVENIRMENPLVIEGGGRQALDIGMNEMLIKAKAAGHVGFIFKRLRTGSHGVDEESTVYAKF